MAKNDPYTYANLIDDNPKILVFQMRQQLSALGLEIKGIRFSRGSVAAYIKMQHGIKARSKKDVYKIFHAMILEREKELGIPERPLNKSEKEILEEK